MLDSRHLATRLILGFARGSRFWSTRLDPIAAVLVLLVMECWRYLQQRTFGAASCGVSAVPIAAVVEVLELSVVVLPRTAWRDRFDRIPVLDNLAVG